MIGRWADHFLGVGYGGIATRLHELRLPAESRERVLLHSKKVIQDRDINVVDWII
jgi:hypothetical protein